MVLLPGGNTIVGRKTLRLEGQDGTVFDYATFQANDDPTLKLALYARVT